MGSGHSLKTSATLGAHPDKLDYVESDASICLDRIEEPAAGQEPVVAHDLGHMIFAWLLLTTSNDTHSIRTP
jgi:hypothetical protein